MAVREVTLFQEQSSPFKLLSKVCAHEGAAPVEVSPEVVLPYR
jgi:hypothetical protein